MGGFHQHSINRNVLNRINEGQKVSYLQVTKSITCQGLVFVLPSRQATVVQLRAQINKLKPVLICSCDSVKGSQHARVGRWVFLLGIWWDETRRISKVWIHACCIGHDNISLFPDPNWAGSRDVNDSMSSPVPAPDASQVTLILAVCVLWLIGQAKWLSSAVGGSKCHETWNHLIGCSKKRHHPSKDMPYPISQFESSEQGSVKCKSTWENPMGSHTYFIQLGWPMWGPRYFLKQSSNSFQSERRLELKGWRARLWQTHLGI